MPVAATTPISTDSPGTRSVLYPALLLVFILVPIVNFGAPLFPGGDEQFTDYGSTRVDAAPYAFSIWLPIFIGMLGFAIRVFRQSEPDSQHLRSAAVGLIVAGVASILFVPISLYLRDTFVFVNIVMHLLALGFAKYHLHRHRALVPLASSGRIWFFGPSMYLGWISAATVISTALMAQDITWVIDPTIATVVACSTLGAVTTVALLMLRNRDLVYAGTIAWALVAIGVQQADFPPVRWTAWASAVVILVCWMLAVVSAKKQPSAELV